jgi:hypothetical protein
MAQQNLSKIRTQKKRRTKELTTFFNNSVIRAEPLSPALVREATKYVPLCTGKSPT